MKTIKYTNFKVNDIENIKELRQLSLSGYLNYSLNSFLGNAKKGDGKLSRIERQIHNYSMINISSPKITNRNTPDSAYQRPIYYDNYRISHQKTLIQRSSLSSIRLEGTKQCIP